MSNKIFTFNTDIDELVAKFKDEISASVAFASAQLARDIRSTIEDTYQLQNRDLLHNVVTLGFNGRTNTATIKVVSRSFNAIRLMHKPPLNQGYPGYTDVLHNRSMVSQAKMFPIRFKSGVRILVTRSGIGNITESWQPRQSAMPFTLVKRLDRILPRTRETVFKTYERLEPRTHTFKIPRTLDTVSLVETKLDSLLKQLPKNIVYELSRPKPSFKRKKNKEPKAV